MAGMPRKLSSDPQFTEKSATSSALPANLAQINYSEHF
jgi:hypothetical protein